MKPPYVILQLIITKGDFKVNTLDFIVHIRYNSVSKDGENIEKIR